MEYILVAVGGMLGSVARYWLSSMVQQFNGSEFPLGTLSVNVVGSFILGLVASLFVDRDLASQQVRLLVGVGFCGGFTTMSAFSYETTYLLREGSVFSAAGNVVATIVTCFCGVWLGGLLARMILRFS